MGLELLAEAGNYAAFQRLYGGGPPYIGGWPYPQVPSGAPTSNLDLYYRQAAAAAALQKPLPYRLYPGTPLVPGPSASAATPFSHLTASNSLSSLSNYYSNNNNSSKENNKNSSNDLSSPQRSPSPTLNPGSPERNSERDSQSDTEDAIQV